MIDINELRRYSRKIGHPAGGVPSMMLAAADEIERLHGAIAGLRAKITEMEKQEPVAFALCSGVAFKAAYLKEHEAAEQKDRRQLSADLGGSLEAYRVVPLYALPGAKGE